MHTDWVGPLLLDATEIDRVPGGIPGVYLLQRFDNRQGRYEVFYVGTSLDLRSRLSSHLRGRHPNPAIAEAVRSGNVYFSATPVLNTRLRTTLERSLIRRLRPHANRLLAESPDLHCHLPPFDLRLPRKPE